MGTPHHIRHLRSHHVVPFLPLYLSFPCIYMAMAPQETPSKRARYVTYHDPGWGYERIAGKFSTSIKRVRDAVCLASLPLEQSLVGHLL